MYESPRKKGRPLTENERTLISHLLRLGHTQTDIAKVIGVYPSTICRELRRGEVELLNSDKWIYYKTYSPQKAQMQADYMKTAHGPDLKIGNRRDYLAALEAHMLTGSSPEDAISKVGDDYGIRISKTTCYRYIKMRLFPSLRYKHLPQGHPKKGKGQVHRRRNRKGSATAQTRDWPRLVHDLQDVDLRQWPGICRPSRYRCSRRDYVLLPSASPA